MGSSKNENVTRCLKPFNLKVIRTELFRAYKCVKNADWGLLFKPYDQGLETSIFEKYPPVDQREVEIRYEIEEMDEDINAAYDEYNFAKNKKARARKQKYKKKSKKGGGGKGKGNKVQQQKTKSYTTVNGKYKKRMVGA